MSPQKNHFIKLIFFTGLNKILEGFKSWDWKFAKTPNFTIYKNVGFPELKDGTMRIGILVEKSVVAQVLLDIPEGVSWSGFTGTVPIVTSLVGQKFTPALFVQVEDAIRSQPIKLAGEPEKKFELTARI